MSRRSPHSVDEHLARLRFERAASRYAGAARLETEVGTRMLERLDYVKLAPRRVLDAASGPSLTTRALRARYPQAEMLALDFSLGMLHAARGSRLGRWMRRAPQHLVCADLSRLPLAQGSVQLVWCNMALHWISEPLGALREFHRVLDVEGLLMFSTLGPDTLKELRAAAGEARVHRFVDMHDLGDMLVAAGFSAPVMDMEMLSVTYGRGEQLLDDLRASGQSSARVDRSRGLGGRQFRERLRASLAGLNSVSYEVVYGHAWKGAPKTDAQGRAIVRMEMPRRRKG